MMNASDVKKLLKFADATNFGEDFAVLAGDLADLLHNNKAYVVYTDTRHAAALLKWQGKCFDGSWDQVGLNECIDWMRFRVQITDLEQAMDTLPKRRAKKAVEVEPVGDPTYLDPRFANIEL